MSSVTQHLSFKGAALKILKGVSEPLTSKEITEKALEQGLISTEGNTPEATMGAILYVDIKKNKKSQFKKVGRGKFTLIDQEESSTSPLLLVEKQNKLVESSLYQSILHMDPYQFEFFVGDLLQEIGYENVEVTKRSGDNGIDLNANLTMDGITNVKTVIQAKRYQPSNKVSGSTITQLRGSAEVDQRGLVITTSDFTKDAISESKAPNKMPVSLINGEKLLALLLKHGIGVKKDSIEILSLDSEYFEGDEREIPLGSSSGKSKALWPLPGGTTSYVETLILFLEAVKRGTNTKNKLIRWFMETYDTVQSEKTAKGYINVPRNMGLIFMKDNNIVLTEDGKKFLDNKDLEVLYEVVSSNILAFDDIVEFLRNENTPQTTQDILEYLTENFDIVWKTFAQVNFRIGWLLNLHKIEKAEGGFIAKN